MIAGKRIMIEIGKRGSRGYFFNYEQYRELRATKELDAAKIKIVQFGYAAVADATTVKEIVDRLQTSENRKTTIWIMLEMVFWFIVSLATCS